MLVGSSLAMSLTRDGICAHWGMSHVAGQAGLPSVNPSKSMMNPAYRFSKV